MIALRMSSNSSIPKWTLHQGSQGSYTVRSSETAGPGGDRSSGLRPLSPSSGQDPKNPSQGSLGKPSSPPPLPWLQRLYSQSTAASPDYLPIAKRAPEEKGRGLGKVVSMGQKIPFHTNWSTGQGDAPSLACPGIHLKGTQVAAGPLNRASSHWALLKLTSFVN